MKTFLWKLRYAFYFKRKTCVSWSMAWADAGAMAEDAIPDELTPAEAAEESIDAWIQSQ